MDNGKAKWTIPLIAATGGLALGLLVRWVPGRQPTKTVPEVAGPVAGNSSKFGKSTRIGTAVSSPTLRFLNDLAEAPASRCEELYHEICTFGDSQRKLELQAVFSRWMELVEPTELLEKLVAEEDSQKRRFWSAPFFEAWVARDPASAMAAKDGDFAQIRALVAIRRGAPGSLEGNLEIWDPEKSEIADALALLGEDHPELAKGVADYKGGNPDKNVKLIAAVAGGWARKDPQAAFDWVTSLGLMGKTLQEAGNPIFDAWIRDDWDAAKAAAKSVDFDTSRGMGAEDTWSQLRDTESSRSLQLLLLRQNPFAEMKDLYQKFSESTVDWDKVREFPLAIDSDGWFVTDPERKLAEAEELPPGKLRDFLMVNLCGQWADRHPEEAVEYAKAHGLSLPASRYDLLPESLGADPAATLEALVSGENPAPESRQKLMNQAMRWAESDPQAAAAWLLARPDSISYDFKLDSTSAVLLDNTLGYSWAKIDAVGATEWVEDLPEGRRKEEAWGAMRSYVSEEYSPDLAFTSTATILQGERRLDFLKADLKNVAEKIGLPAAREMLGSTTLGAEERQALEESLEKPPTP